MKYVYFLFLLVIYGCNDRDVLPIRVKEEHINFGHLNIGEEYNYTLLLKNISKDTLYIDTITTSCECVILKKKLNFILPHNKDSISFSFISKEEGYITRGLAILFNNYQEPLIITIEGEILENK